MQNKSTNKKRSVLFTVGALLILLAPCLCSCGDKTQKSRQQEIDKKEKELKELVKAFGKQHPEQDVEKILQLHTAKDPNFTAQAKKFCKELSDLAQKMWSLFREMKKLATYNPKKKEIQQMTELYEQLKNELDTLVQRGTDDELADMLKEYFGSLSSFGL